MVASKELPLTRGYVALVDAADYEWLSQWKWHFDNNYAARGFIQEGKVRKVYLHVQIMGKQDGQEIDHVNRNKLDCQRSNLRFVSRSENMQNINFRQGTSSQYRGVCWHKQKGKWLASITVNYKQISLGLYTTEVDAALAYDHAARSMYGTSAFCNFPKSESVRAATE